jgi:hypothetical protein
VVLARFARNGRLADACYRWAFCAFLPTALPRFVTTAQAVSSSPEVANGLREFLIDRVSTDANEHDEAAQWRRAAIPSQLMGMAWSRYIMRVEPLASASRAEIAARVGPPSNASRSIPNHRSGTGEREPLDISRYAARAQVVPQQHAWSPRSSLMGSAVTHRSSSTSGSGWSSHDATVCDGS